MSRREIEQVIVAQTVREGAGFIVHRPFPRPGLEQFDPFLLLDEMGPNEHGPGEASGAPDHPHRGFETVTYLMSGEMQHRDSHGNAGTLRAGGVQWMTAGAGVVHSEMPSEAFQRSGGTMHGFQIWVNLPKSEKMRTPRYQDIAPESLVWQELAPGVGVKLIGGRVGPIEGAAQTVVPVTIAHLRLEAGAAAEIPVDESHHAAVYVIGGEIAGDGETIPRERFVVYGKGSVIELRAGGDGADILLFSGQPLREPVARYGPFVMNYRHEIEEAVEDYQAGRFGEIGPEVV